MEDNLKRTLKSLTPIIIIYLILASLVAQFYRNILCAGCIQSEFGPTFSFGLAFIILLIHFLLYYNKKAESILIKILMEFISIIIFIFLNFIFMTLI